MGVEDLPDYLFVQEEKRSDRLPWEVLPITRKTIFGIPFNRILVGEGDPLFPRVDLLAKVPGRLVVQVLQGVAQPFPIRVHTDSALTAKGSTALAEILVPSGIPAANLEVYYNWKKVKWLVGSPSYYFSQ